jgi:hypothetical protein
MRCVLLRNLTGLTLLGCGSSSRTDGFEHREAKYSSYAPRACEVHCLSQIVVVVIIIFKF